MTEDPGQQSFRTDLIQLLREMHIISEEEEIKITPIIPISGLGY